MRDELVARGVVVRGLVTDPGPLAPPISDRGPGTADDLRRRLFQPFAAGDVRSGSGLGLVICAEIVRALDGGIVLENRERHGHVEGLDATVRLPLATMEANGTTQD